MERAIHTPGGDFSTASDGQGSEVGRASEEKKKSIFRQIRQAEEEKASQICYSFQFLKRNNIPATDDGKGLKVRDGSKFVENHVLLANVFKKRDPKASFRFLAVFSVVF